MYRMRIVEEDRLVNDRMLWLILSQPMFFGAFFVLATSGLHSNQKALIFSIIIFSGILISWLSISSVRAARDEIDWLMKRFKNYHNDIDNNTRILDLTGQLKRHHSGHTLSSHLPRIYLFIWVSLAIYSVTSLMFKPQDQNTTGRQTRCESLCPILYNESLALINPKVIPNVKPIYAQYWNASLSAG